jgi:hypothetical protein
MHYKGGEKLGRLVETPEAQIHLPNLDLGQGTLPFWVPISTALICDVCIWEP